jgi:hypothetical protein
MASADDIAPITAVRSTPTSVRDAPPQPLPGNERPPAHLGAERAPDEDEAPLHAPARFRASHAPLRYPPFRKLRLPPARRRLRHFPMDQQSHDHAHGARAARGGLARRPFAPVEATARPCGAHSTRTVASAPSSLRCVALIARRMVPPAGSSMWRYIRAHVHGWRPRSHHGGP